MNTRIFLVEVKIDKTDKRLEPISLQSNFEKAYELIGDRIGIITEMEIDKIYPEGIGICNHWHFGEEENEIN